MKTLKFTKVRDVKTPEYGTKGSAGIDFFVPNFGKPFVLPPQTDLLIPSGIIMNIPEGHMLLGADKSGVVTSRWACVGAGRKPKDDAFNSPIIIGAKVIDWDYQGEMWIHLINTGSYAVQIEPGQKIAQFILVPIEHAKLKEVSADKIFTKETKRGKGGFGSTNKK